MRWVQMISLGSVGKAISIEKSIEFPFSFSLPFIFKRQIVLFVLLLALLLSAFGTVYMKDINRRYMGTLQTLQATQATLQNQYSQLLLEKSTWSNQARIQSLASRELGMAMPTSSVVLAV